MINEIMNIGIQQCLAYISIYISVILFSSLCMCKKTRIILYVLFYNSNFQKMLFFSFSLPKGYLFLGDNLEDRSNDDQYQKCIFNLKDENNQMEEDDRRAGAPSHQARFLSVKCKHKIRLCYYCLGL